MYVLHVMNRYLNTSECINYNTLVCRKTGPDYDTVTWVINGIHNAGIILI